jgi:hypothetical protein
MWNLVTLEGFFEGAKKWDLDFHEYVREECCRNCTYSIR